ncbi:MAG TPA: hypothetical protein VOA64_19130 [Candidatus Dormibacteraeota bacterium]|nr:hypothetical protein [Candidatus Dormibacteraeota bacterium]
MSRFKFLPVVSLIAGLLVPTYLLGQKRPVTTPPKTKEAKILSAMSAAPPAIAKNATILDWPEAKDGPMVELRKGTNGWTCLPKMSTTPANDPMCMDTNAMEWAQAWMSKKEPKLSGAGIGYMLKGGSTPDNDDPFATKPPAGKDWLWEPPHIMLFGVKIDSSVYTSEPNTTRPWVMFKGTPYEHLMVPVR